MTGVKNKIKDNNKDKITIFKKNKNKRKINFKQINILNLNFKPLKDCKAVKEKVLNKNGSSTGLSKESKIELIKRKNKSNINNAIIPDYSFIPNNIDIREYIKPSLDNYDYDIVIEEDKRTFFQYYFEKIKEKQMIINSFFISESIRPKSIKIAFFIMTIDIYFVTNALFYSDSYISKVFNSTEEEKFYSFITRSIDRFVFITIVANIIEYFIKHFFVEEIIIKKALLKNKENSLNIRYEVTEIIKSILKKIKILIIIDYIIIIFSWYYLSCFNNVYPIINKEMIFSSLFIFTIMQIYPFLFTFLETFIRFTSIRYESEKLFKLSLLLS